MCEYCEKMKSILFRENGIMNDIDRLELYIEPDKTMTFSHQNMYTYKQENINIKINYCPMCGKRLSNEPLA